MLFMSLYKNVGFYLGPIGFLCVRFTPLIPLPDIPLAVIAVATWMIVWWITEAVSISVTALLPLTLFPLLGVMQLNVVAANYAHPIIYLFFGGFVIALALEKVNLHRRIALTILTLTGTHANGIIFGFMVSTALMSMWISNTASTLVMLPIAYSVIVLLIDDKDGYTKNDQRFVLTIMLGIAFAANIGGMATLVGTPPNSVMLAFLNSEYGLEVGFFTWMQMGVPLSVLLLLIAYVLLVKVIYPNNLGQLQASREVFKGELAKLGPMRKEEQLVLLLFMATALCWMFRVKINQWVPGLNVSDTSISMLAAVAMFVVPVNWRKASFVLDWDDTSRLPWGILVLFGGGLALASGLSQAGLIDLVGAFISSKADWSVFVITGALVFLMLFMTELMGNVALVTILVPVVAGIATGIDAPLLGIVVPVTLASSCAFMLPMATPPNAIVFASGRIKVYEMARAGFVMNLVSVIVLMAVSMIFIPLLF